MDITITISEKIEQIIREKAEENGKPVSEFATDFFEEKIKEEFSERKADDAPHPLLKLAGMFSSGRTDTSRRYKEILMEEIDKRGGFGGS